jgi:phage major head subunit gpT-like protein
LDPPRPFYSTVAKTVPSTTAMNEYPRLDDMPGIREWIGDRLVHDLSASTYQIRNREFEKTIGIKRSQIEDDQIGIFAPGGLADRPGCGRVPRPAGLAVVYNRATRSSVTMVCISSTPIIQVMMKPVRPTSVSNYTAGAAPALVPGRRYPGS